ncbi:serine hydrolase domain-containing protein [Maritalea mediterranea]|uniref:Beta-lactamase family protein n=1 Tax=Maritalea mediterranea TaxID=2909667 RepID=A0ABS9E328_9HYPH|nr:beta-lactamase family protein [Maritalea mediterranea]
MEHALLYSGELQHLPRQHVQTTLPSGRLIAAFSDLAHQHDFITSVLILKNGHLIGKSEKVPGAAKRPSNVKSVAKSILSALVGIAVTEGHLASIDVSLSHFYPDLPAAKRNITIRHLLTMTAGFEFAENSAASNRVYQGQNWTRNILDLPQPHQPGEKFNYATASTYVLADILTRATGEDLAIYAQRKLFTPLGGTLHAVTRSPEGTVFGGTDFYLTPELLAKFGQLYLDEGRWDQHQLIPRSWIRQSWQMNQGPWPANSSTAKKGYGFLWWLKDLSGQPAYIAEGFGGHLLVILPNEDAVIVVGTEPLEWAAGWWDTHPRRAARLYELIQQNIMPALAREGGISWRY